MILVDLAQYSDLHKPDSNFVDPYKVAELHKNANGTTFTLPSSNVRFMGAKTVQEGFREAVFNQLSDDRSAMEPGKRHTMLETFYELARISTDPAALYEYPDNAVYVYKCASCGAKTENGFKVIWGTTSLKCPVCASKIFATDAMRLHEEVTDFSSNEVPLTRFMNAAEHLIIAGFVRMLAEFDPATLSQLAIIVDGPLAIFGQPAWLSRRLMRLYYEINKDLSSRGLPPFIMLGLQKEGQLMDHARSIDRFIPNGRILLVDDDYRNVHVRNNDSAVSNNFGDETYYGQDFILKTESGSIFIVAVPYPFPAKPGMNFKSEKAKMSNYPELSRSLDVIRHFEFDLYHSSVVPVALAHRHASISLVPGGKVLDLITRRGLAHPRKPIK